jgi:hypothetical protein
VPEIYHSQIYLQLSSKACDPGSVSDRNPLLSYNIYTDLGLCCVSYPLYARDPCVGISRPESDTLNMQLSHGLTLGYGTGLT